MKNKTELLKEIKSTQSKAMKSFKSKRKNGKKVNKLLEKVIKLEDQYFERFGTHPSKEYGDIYNKKVKK